MIRTILLSILVLGTASAFAADSISHALPCGQQGTVGGLGAGADLQRYTIDNSKFPHAVCNDGTPAIFYFGAATTVADRNKWMIFLQGGGACVSGQQCAERWCHIETNYGMDKMSSSLSKPQIRGNGFLSPGAQNKFGTWNRVLIYYCSSDQWDGTKETTTSATSAGGATVEYTLQFRGAEIIDAVIDTLRYAAPGNRRRVVRHDLENARPLETWPDLDEATHVIFAGSSGGGNGAKVNADHVGEKLRAANPGLVDYRAIIDASFTFDTSSLDYTKTTYCASDPAGCSYASFVEGTWNAVDRSFLEARGDASCRSYHALRGNEWMCQDKDHVLMHHVSTPFFVHQDLQDPRIGGAGFVDVGLGTPSDYARGVEAALRNWPIPEEARVARPKSFAPQCMTHEAFTNDSDVFTIKVQGINWNDTVWNWWTGASAQQEAISVFNGTPGAAFGCPPQ